MLLVKLGILAFLGKGIYSSFLAAHLIQHTTHSLKMKLRQSKEVVKCSQLEQH
jgi:23S rRNA maturation mini-RNase III